MQKCKGIILAGGNGSRLYPLTKCVSKQLLPIYNKPMIYYPLSNLITAGIKDILIITRPQDINLFRNLLGDGSDYNINLTYASQNQPNGLPEAFKIGKDFIGNSSVCLVLGDNLFYGMDDLIFEAKSDIENERYNNINFAYKVSNPEDYGVFTFDENGDLKNIEEKPKNPKSNLAMQGLYFFDNEVVKCSLDLNKSDRGETEITDLVKLYIKNNKKIKVKYPKYSVWLDTGTFDNLQKASNFVQTIEERQGISIGSLKNKN